MALLWFIMVYPMLMLHDSLYVHFTIKSRLLLVTFQAMDSRIPQHYLRSLWFTTSYVCHSYLLYNRLQLSDDSYALWWFGQQVGQLMFKNLSYLSGVWRGKERRRKEGYIKDDWMMIGWGMHIITIWIGTLNE